MPYYEHAAKDRQKQLNNKETASVISDRSESGNARDFAAAKVQTLEKLEYMCYTCAIVKNRPAMLITSEAMV